MRSLEQLYADVDELQDAIDDAAERDDAIAWADFSDLLEEIEEEIERRSHKQEKDQ